jgi:SNF2 family DNA or RNA helicase
MSFSTTTDLMPHQRTAVAKLLPSRVTGLLMDMGTGKSRTLIELAKLRAGKWDRFFWFCPCALKETVRHELIKHTDLASADICVFDDVIDDQTAPRDRLFYVVGIESMAASNRVVLSINALVTDRSFVAVDESAYIKGHRAKRTQRITGIGGRARYRAVLTGTPITQGAVDLYSQMAFLSPKILGYRSFWSFAANHLEYEVRKIDGRERRTGRIVRSHNTDYLAARIAPYVYQVRKDECLDLPEKLHADRFFSMTGDQQDMYDRAKNEILLDCHEDDWSPIRIFRLFTALQTITCGFWNRLDLETGERELLTVTHRRISLLMAVLNEIPEGEHVIIWGKYQHAIAEISAALTEKYGLDQVAQYHGAISSRDRAGNLARWRENGGFLVASQGIGGHGHTFNEAAYSIFYADGYKFSERIQAEDRNHRIGQDRRPVYTSLICSGSIDDKVSAALARKGNAMEEFQQRVNVHRDTGTKAKAIEMVRKL